VRVSIQFQRATIAHTVNRNREVPRGTREVGTSFMGTTSTKTEYTDEWYAKALHFDSPYIFATGKSKYGFTLGSRISS
jgi:hypothetical protein